MRAHMIMELTGYLSVAKSTSMDKKSCLVFHPNRDRKSALTCKDGHACVRVVEQCMVL